MHKKRRINTFYTINPIVKIILILFLVCLVFLANNFLSNICLLVLIFVLWFSIKPQWKHTKIIIYSIFFIFALILLINWVVVKTPSVVIFNRSKIEWWGGNNIFGKEIPEINYNYFIAHAWGSDYYMPPFSHYLFTTGSYAEAHQYFSDMLKHFGKGDYSVYMKSVYVNGVTHWIGFGYKAAWYSLSVQSLVYAFTITVKISSMIVLISLLTITTTNVQLSYAFYVLLLPLKVFKAPIKEWSLILSLSFRFVPTLVDESKRIMNAQASRGVDFSNGNYLDKIKSLVALIIPVFTIGFLKSIDLANAMEARGFIANSVTTKYRQYKITAYDLIVLFLVGIIMAFILMLIILHVILTPIGIFDLSIQNK